MKLGVFGDSYADFGNDINRIAWPALVKKGLNCEAHFFAKAGSSLFYSYELFLKHYKKFDTIIFTFSSSNRWPALPSEYSGKEYNIGYTKIDPLMDHLNTYFFTLFPDNLLNLISSAIHRNVVKICKDQGIYLIQIIPFSNYKDRKIRFDFDFYENDFPLITGLDIISHLEQINIEGKVNYTCKYLAEKNMQDYRMCHLNKTNNIMLADMLIDYIKNMKYNIDIRCEQLNWTYIED